MSGHSKWATTKRQKAVTDAKRSNLFTKLANLISVAARAGGDPTMNFQLRLAIDQAKAANMPKDNIERAIKRGTGELGGAQIEEITYEIYGPAGTAIIVEAATDNKNRTSAEIKAVLNRSGGKLSESGGVMYLFERRGEIRVGSGPACSDAAASGRALGVGSENSTEEIEMRIIDSGALDYEQIDTDFLIYTRPDELKKVADALESSGVKIDSSQLIFAPKSPVDLDEADSDRVIKLLEVLDELDDAVSVSSNLG